LTPSRDRISAGPKVAITAGGDCSKAPRAGVDGPVEDEPSLLCWQAPIPKIIHERITRRIRGCFICIVDCHIRFKFFFVAESCPV
jgi:hypothetical protein